MTTKKTIKRKGAGKKRAKSKWQRDLLTTPEIKRTDVVLQFDEAGNVRAVTHKEAQQNTKRMKVKAKQDGAEFWTRAKTVRSKNRRLLGKRAQDALSMLFAWAIATGRRNYGEWLSPDDQRDLLEAFGRDAYAGIGKAKFQKQRYDTTEQAYQWIAAKMTRFRQRHGVAQKLSKEFWAEIKQAPQWQRLVKRHGGNDDALRRGVNRLWRQEQGKLRAFPAHVTPAR